jgi:hypothetical protein
MIPNGAIGARFSPDGGTLYLTDVTGLGIFDLTNPDSPQIRAHLPLPRVAAGGEILLVDVSDPSAPAVRASHATGSSGLTVYDVRDLSRPAGRAPEGREELAWITTDTGTFAFDITDPVRPRLLLGGPGEPGLDHQRMLAALSRRARRFAWPGHGAPVGFYVSAGSFWGAYLAPDDCPPIRSRGRFTGRSSPSPIGDGGRPASWGRGPVTSPTAFA